MYTLSSAYVNCVMLAALYACSFHSISHLTSFQKVMSFLAVPNALDSLACISALGHPLFVIVPPRYVTWVAAAIGCPLRKLIVGEQFIEMRKHFSMLSFMLYSAVICSIACTGLFIDSCSFVMSNVSSAYRSSGDSVCSGDSISSPISCLTSSIKTVIRMMNRYGDSGHPCLIPVLWLLYADIPSLSLILNFGEI